MTGKAGVNNLTIDDFTPNDRERTMSLLLSQERVITLLYGTGEVLRSRSMARFGSRSGLGLGSRNRSGLGLGPRNCPSSLLSLARVITHFHVRDKRCGEG